MKRFTCFNLQLKSINQSTIINVGSFNKFMTLFVHRRRYSSMMMMLLLPHMIGTLLVWEANDYGGERI